MVADDTLADDLVAGEGAADPQALLAIATEVAATAAAMIIKRVGEHGLVDTKANPLDLVTEVDRASEELITSMLLDARPDDGLVGEEGVNVTGTSGVDWVIDPIDGTTSFVYGLPGFSVSIAATHGGETVAGVVHAPMIGAVYQTAAGRGTTYNQRRVDCSDVVSLDRALIATGFAPDDQRRTRQGAQLAKLLPEIRDIRRMGSAALDLAAVASGQVDAYYEVGLNRWDYAAGVLLVAEAGGKVIVEPDAASGRAFIAAAAPGIADALFARLRDLGADKV